jgi:hemoglobin
MIAPVAIFDDIGGHAAIKTAVTVFYERVVDDETLARWFEDIDLTKLRAHQRAFLTAALGGPEIFAGRDLRTAHHGLAITDVAFTTIIEHLIETLRDLDVDDDVLDAVAARVEALRSQVVE